MFRKITLTYILLFTINLISFAQTPSYEWAKNVSGSRNECVNSIATDDQGNVYGGGFFDGVSGVFGSTILSNTSSTGFSDAFLAKYDSIGNILWIRTIGGLSSEQIRAIDVDAEGNAYVLGTFSSSSVTIGNFVLTNSVLGSCFLAKYDDNGNVLWAKKIGSSVGVDVIDVSNTGKISLSGFFTSSTAVIESIDLTNTNVNFSDVFVAQYDLSGNFLWVKQVSGMAAESSQTIEIDSSGNTYFGFNFASQSVDVENTVLVNSSNIVSGITYFSDFVVVKLSPTGELIWANRYGGNDDDFIASITIDANENIFFSGSFKSNTLSIDGIILNSSSGQLFNSKLTQTADVIWATNTGASSRVTSSIVDDNGNLYVSGNFFGSASFNGINVSSSSNAAVFLAKFNSIGWCEWVKSSSAISYTTTQAVKRLATNNLGDLFFSGFYNNSTFALDSFSFTNTNSFLNSFISKIKYTSLSNNSFDYDEVFISPNPTDGIIFIDGLATNETQNFAILDLMGREVVNQPQIIGGKIDVSNLNSGIYFLRMNQMSYKFIKK